MWAAERPDLEQLLARPDWHADALCKEHPGVSFILDRGESAEPAKSICAMCAVRPECLAYALEHQPLGVWGGTTSQERKRMRRVVTSTTDDVAEARRRRVAELYATGRNAAAIADYIGVSHVTVGRDLRRLGLAKRQAASTSAEGCTAR